MRIQFLSRRDHFTFLSQELNKLGHCCSEIDLKIARGFLPYPTKKYINSIKCDLMISHNPFYGLRGAVLAKSKGKTQKVGFRIKADHWTEMNSKVPFKNRIGYFMKKRQYENSVKLVDFSLAISNYIKEKAEKNGLNKVHLLHNGVDIIRFKPCTKPVHETDVLIVMNFNILEKIKALNTFLELYNLPYNITILGDGLYKNIIKKPKNVVLKGLVMDPERYYTGAKIVVHPTSLESFGNIALEAGACGKPFISMNIGGLKDTVINGHTGILVNDIQDMIKHISRLMEREDLMLKIGTNAREHIEKNYTWEKIAIQANEVFKSIS
jgi:glycosyltransferase involved in cell wall biosynthesis